MATITLDYFCDLKKAVKVQYVDGMVFSGDNGGNTINVFVMDGDNPATISGDVVADVIRCDGGTVAVTGAIEGNKAYIILPAACYSVPGVISIVIKISQGTTITTICALVANVYRSSTDAIIDPGTILPSVQYLITQINTAVASIPADYSALWTKLAPSFSTDTSYVAGQHVTYNGGLYRFIKTHSGAWASGDVTSVSLGNEIYSVNSAFVNNEINNNAFDILLPLQKANNTQNGVTFTWNADGTECTIDTGGSASSGLAVNNIFNVDANSFPSGIKAGDTIRIMSLGTEENVFVQIYIATNGTFTPDPQRSTNGYMEYTIPYDATGVKIRLAVRSGSTLNNLKIKPQILTNVKTNKELEKAYEFANKGVLPTNTDVNNVKEDGRYILSSGYTYTNIPTGQEAYTLEVLHTTDNVILQRLTGYDSGKMYIRTSASGSFSGRAWVEIPIMADINNSLFPNKGTVPTNTDIDTIRDTGIWFLTSSCTYTHSPLPAGYGGIMLVFKYSNNSIIQMVSKAGTGEMYIRASLLGNFPETWAMGGTVNNYISEHFENTYNITCEPEITTDTNNFLASTGDNTDRTGDIQTMLNTTGVCHLGPGLFVVSGVEIPDYATLDGCGTATLLRLAASVESGYAVKLKTEGHVSNMRISGGTSAPTLTATVGTRHGILFEGTKVSGQSGGTTYKRSSIDNVLIRYFEGGGITCTGTGVDIDSNLLISNCFVDHCGVGIYIPYYSEFHRIANCAFTYCWYGCIDNGGNNNFANCDFSGNKVGILIDNSSDQSTNNSHGTFGGCSVNHSYSEAGVINEGIAIKLLKSNLGEIFTGMQIFYGAIILDKCVGTRFIGANVGSKVPITITDSTVVTFSDCTFKEGPTHADSTFTQSNNTVLKFTDCYLRDGTTYDPMSA